MSNYHSSLVPKKSNHLWFGDNFKTLKRPEKEATISSKYESVRVSSDPLEASLKLDEASKLSKDSITYYPSRNIAEYKSDLQSFQLSSTALPPKAVSLLSI